MILIVPMLMLLASLIRLATHILAVDTGRRGRETVATILSVNRTIIHQRPAVGGKVRCDYLLTMEFESAEGKHVRVKPIVAGHMHTGGGRFIPQWAPGDRIPIRHHRRFVSIIRVLEGVQDKRAVPIIVWTLVCLCLTAYLVYLCGA